MFPSAEVFLHLSELIIVFYIAGFAQWKADIMS